MAEIPIKVTVQDIENPTLLVRLLRNIVAKLGALGDRIEAVAKSIAPTPLPDIRKSLEATGSTPLNVTGLPGVLRDPQPAAALRYTAVPTGLPLQSLFDSQLLLVKNGTGFDLYTVVGGNPNSLTKLIGGATGSTYVTLDTTQVITGAKTFGDGTGAPSINIDGAAGQNRVLNWLTAGIGRWRLRANNTAEGGANAGTDLEIVGLSDAGALLGVYVSIARSSGNLTLLKLISSYNGLTTAGQGVPPILVVSQRPGLNAAVAATNLLAAAPAGIYRISYFIDVTTTGAVGTAGFNVLYTHAATALSQAGTGFGQTANTNLSGTFIVQNDAATNIQYSVTGITAGTVYDLYITLERLN